MPYIVVIRRASACRTAASFKEELNRIGDRGSDHDSRYSAVKRLSFRTISLLGVRVHYEAVYSDGWSRVEVVCKSCEY